MLIMDIYPLESDLDEAFYVAALIMILGVMLVSYVITAVLTSALFKKMGIEQWKAWVPVYNSWVFLEAANMNGAWALLALGSLIPGVGWVLSLASAVFLAIAAYRIAVGFARDATLYTVLYVLISPVYLGILGFGRATYDQGRVPTQKI